MEVWALEGDFSFVRDGCFEVVKPLVIETVGGPGILTGLVKLIDENACPCFWLLGSTFA